MIYVTYVVAGLFIALAFTMLYVFYRNAHVGMFIMGAIYGSSGLLAILLEHWWPLLAGFVLVWMLKLLGLEPGAEPPGESKADIEPPSRRENQLQESNRGEEERSK